MRFTLRELLVVFLLIAVCVAVVVNRQKRISAIDGLSSYNFYFAYSGPVARLLRRPTVAWVGGYSEASSADLQLLANIPSIRTLMLSGQFPEVDDEAIVPNRTLKRLRHLELPRNTGDGALADVVTATHLTYLSAGKTQPTLCSFKRHDS